MDESILALCVLGVVVGLIHEKTKAKRDFRILLAIMAAVLVLVFTGM